MGSYAGPLGAITAIPAKQVLHLLPWCCSVIHKCAFMLPAILRKLVRSSLELPLISLGLLLYYSGLAPLVIWLRRRSPRVLMFHAVEDEESDFIRGLSINTRPAQFAAQLEFLKRHYQIVPMSAYGIEPLPARAVVITFDDGFRSVYQHAFPLLKAAGVAATCYLSTDVIGNRSMIWLNELTWFLHRHPSRARANRFGLAGTDRDVARAVSLIERLIASYDRLQNRRAAPEELRASIGIAPEAVAREASTLSGPPRNRRDGPGRDHIRKPLGVARRSFPVVGGGVPGRADTGPRLRSKACPGRSDRSLIRSDARMKRRGESRSSWGTRPCSKSKGLNNPVDPLRRRTGERHFDLAGGAVCANGDRGPDQVPLETVLVQIGDRRR